MGKAGFLAVTCMASRASGRVKHCAMHSGSGPWQCCCPLPGGAACAYERGCACAAFTASASQPPKKKADATECNAAVQSRMSIGRAPKQFTLNCLWWHQGHCQYAVQITNTGTHRWSMGPGFSSQRRCCTESVDRDRFHLSIHFCEANADKNTQADISGNWP